MALNPLVNQGVLNRIRGSVLVVDAPELNVTAPYLTKEGISVAFDGDLVDQLQTLTGLVNSPAPYVMASVTIRVLRTSFLANTYKLRMELSAQLGELRVTPDTTALSPFTFVNCSIAGVQELGIAGQDPGWGIMLRGAYLVNSAMFGLT